LWICENHESIINNDSLINTHKSTMKLVSQRVEDDVDADRVGVG